MSELRGMYRHYKGDLYEVLGLVRDSTNGVEEGREYVLYFSVAKQTRHIRLVTQFHEQVMIDGQWTSRFTRQGDSWADEDQPLPEDEAIRAAHPTSSGAHHRYAEAMRLVGAKRSKYALVDLVNWLLSKRTAFLSVNWPDVLRRHGLYDSPAYRELAERFEKAGLT